MPKVFFLYNLKKGVAMEDYKRWSREIDQKMTPKQEGVNSMEVYEIKGPERGDPPYQIVEGIEVESWEKWQEVGKSKELEKVVKQWNKYGDADTVITIWGDKIE